MKHFKLKDDKYPEIKWRLTEKDLSDLIDINFINDRNELDPSKIGEVKTLSPLEKLLYAVAWKNGDIHKVKHIIEGVLSEGLDENKKYGIVFYQFGRHLSRSNEPIVDQHVLRAFSVKNIGKDNDEEIENARKMEIIKEFSLVKEYIKWLGDNKKLINNHMIIDKILFATGKKIKLKK